MCSIGADSFVTRQAPKYSASPLFFNQQHAHHFFLMLKRAKKNSCQFGSFTVIASGARGLYTRHRVDSYIKARFHSHGLGAAVLPSM